MLLDLLCYKWHSMSQMLVIPHMFKKIGLHNLVVRRIFSDILLVLGLKKVEKHCTRTFENQRFDELLHALQRGNMLRSVLFIHASYNGSQFSFVLPDTSEIFVKSLIVL
jgi:hypothetical protein